MVFDELSCTQLTHLYYIAVPMKCRIGLNFILFVYYMTSIQNNAEYDYNTTTIQMGFRKKSNGSSADPEGGGAGGPDPPPAPGKSRYMGFYRE